MEHAGGRYLQLPARRLRQSGSQRQRHHRLFQACHPASRGHHGQQHHPLHHGLHRLATRPHRAGSARCGPGWQPVWADCRCLAIHHRGCRPCGARPRQGRQVFADAPPGYSEPIPAGYLHVPSPNYRVAFAFRSVPAPGKSTNDAYHYSKRLRMYSLSEAAIRRPSASSLLATSATRPCPTTTSVTSTTCTRWPASSPCASRTR